MLRFNSIFATLLIYFLMLPHPASAQVSREEGSKAREGIRDANGECPVLDERFWLGNALTGSTTRRCPGTPDLVTPAAVAKAKFVNHKDAISSSIEICSSFVEERFKGERSAEQLGFDKWTPAAISSKTVKAPTPDKIVYNANMPPINGQRDRASGVVILWFPSIQRCEVQVFGFVLVRPWHMAPTLTQQGWVHTGGPSRISELIEVDSWARVNSDVVTKLTDMNVMVSRMDRPWLIISVERSK